MDCTTQQVQTHTTEMQEKRQVDEVGKSLSVYGGKARRHNANAVRPAEKSPGILARHTSTTSKTDQAATWKTPEKIPDSYNKTPDALFRPKKFSALRAVHSFSNANQ